MLPQGSYAGEVIVRGRIRHGFDGLGGRQAAIETARDVQGSHRQRRTLLLQQSSRRVLKCRPIPDQRLVGEAESHEPIPLDAANCDPQNIGQLMQGVHAPGHGRGPGVKAKVDQLTGGLSGWHTVTLTGAEPLPGGGASTLVVQTNGPANTDGPASRSRLEPKNDRSSTGDETAVSAN